MSDDKTKKDNLFDYRTKQVFKNYLDGIKPSRYNGLIPSNAINTLNDIKGEDGEVIGDVEIGNDGFVEIMFFTKNKGILKLKKTPTSNPEGYQFGDV